MIVTSIYSDGSRKDVTSLCTIEPNRALTVNNKNITISYTEDGYTENITLEIKVNPKSQGSLNIEIKDLIETKEEDIVYLENIQPNTLVQEVISKIKTNGEVKIYDKNDKEITGEDANIATGIKIVITNGDEKKEFIVVVRGDNNGDGKADFNDMLQMNKHRLEKKLLEGAFLKAGDVDGNGKVDFSDMLKINKFRLEKIKEL